MKVICIKEHRGLTVGKLYEVTSENPYAYELKNDKGKYGQFPKGFLKRVKEVIWCYKELSVF